jgi:hypothetical protein
MSALEALRRKRELSPKKDEGEYPGGARTLKLTDEEAQGLPPGEEVSLTVTGRLGPDGKLDVISVAAAGPGPAEPPTAPPVGAPMGGPPM